MDNNNNFVNLYIECSTTYSTTVNTGIQRVVRNITKELINNQLVNNFKVKLVKLEGDIIFEIKGSDRIDNINIVNLLFILLKNLFNFFYNFKNPKILNKIKDKIKSLFNVKSKGIKAERNDILLLLDSTWSFSIWESVDIFKKQGGIVCVVLYDLIPFTHPQTVEYRTHKSHTSWWLEVNNHTDYIICISKAVRDEYFLWQNKMNLRVKLPYEKIGYFYLGSDFDTDDPVIKVLTSNTNYFLMVGSLEPRKNHLTVLEAFENLWINNHNVKLVIVGAHGWKSSELIERIKNHPKYGTQLFLIRDAGDRDITALYKSAYALISASLSEGFGLPIAEALLHGTNIICSDIPVFREVTYGINVQFFRPLDSVQLALIIKNMHIDITPVTSVSTNHIIKTWSESAIHLCETLTNLIQINSQCGK